MKQTFKPTDEQLTATSMLLTAMAFHKAIQPKFEAMELHLLETGEYRYQDAHYEKEWSDRMDLPADRIVRRLFDVCFMNGLETNPISGDAKRYYDNLRTMCLNSGLADGENAEAVASYNVVKAKRHLLEVTQPFHKVEIDRLTASPKYFDEMIEILLKLLTQFVDHAKLKPMRDEYYSKHTVPRVVQVA